MSFNQNFTIYFKKINSTLALMYVLMKSKSAIIIKKITFLKTKVNLMT